MIKRKFAGKPANRDFPVRKKTKIIPEKFNVNLQTLIQKKKVKQ